jgi:Zn-finger protein
MKKNIILDNQKTYYQIFDDGRVYNESTRKFLKGSITESGYKYYRLSFNKQKYRFYAHQLVALYFLENLHTYKIVNHKDGNKLNNSVENLEWINHSNNVKHAYINNLIRKEKTHDYNIESFKGEKWKTIPDFPKYQVSNFGRVKSFNKKPTRILRPILTNGYYKVVLCNNGIKENCLIAYLVYFTFNKEEKKDNYVIDHIDGNKINNKLDNLRYISRSENTQLSYYSQNLQSNIRPVVCYKNNELIGQYPSCSEAARQLKLDSSSISKVCKGIYKHTHGYIFHYLEKGSTTKVGEASEKR